MEKKLENGAGRAAQSSASDLAQTTSISTSEWPTGFTISDDWDPLVPISVGDLCQNLRAAGPKPEPVEVSKIHIHPGWDRWGLRMVTMTMGGRSSNSQNPDRHWHFIDSCLELTSTWLLKRNITWSRFTYKPLQRIIFWQKRGSDFLKILRQGCKLDCCENYCHESVL